MAKNPSAVALGKLGRGVKKRLTTDERKRRSDRMKHARATRWAASKPKT